MAMALTSSCAPPSQRARYPDAATLPLMARAQRRPEEGHDRQRRHRAERVADDARQSGPGRRLARAAQHPGSAAQRRQRRRRQQRAAAAARGEEAVGIAASAREGQAEGGEGRAGDDGGDEGG
jgi:hypothetical protein